MQIRDDSTDGGMFLGNGGHTMPLSQVELNLDWPAHIAQIYRAAEELTGIKTEAKWEEPPK
ncbi:MAG: hypothetical protein ABR915_09960 [Thermoguttaceae bacterium]|jgi:hypothetical protein